MGIAICEKCERVIDLDENLEDYNFKTCLCRECEEKDEQHQPRPPTRNNPVAEKYA